MSGSSFAAVSQILTRDDLSISLKVSVAIFAITIPFHLFFISISADSFEQKDEKDKKRKDALHSGYHSNLLLSFIGFVVLFAHFGAFSCLSFLVSSLIAFKLMLPGFKWMDFAKGYPKAFMNLIEYFKRKET